MIRELRNKNKKDYKGLSSQDESWRDTPVADSELETMFDIVHTHFYTFWTVFYIHCDENPINVLNQERKRDSEITEFLCRHVIPNNWQPIDLSSQ